MLDELEVLGFELLTGSLQTVDLLELGLLLGQGLTDDLAGLGVGFVADALSVLVGIVDDASAVCWAAISAAEIWRS